MGEAGLTQEGGSSSGLAAEAAAEAAAAAAGAAGDGRGTPGLGTHDPGLRSFLLVFFEGHFQGPRHPTTRPKNGPTPIKKIKAEVKSLSMWIRFLFGFFGVFQGARGTQRPAKKRVQHR